MTLETNKYVYYHYEINIYYTCENSSRLSSVGYACAPSTQTSVRFPMFSSYAYAKVSPFLCLIFVCLFNRHRVPQSLSNICRQVNVDSTISASLRLPSDEIVNAGIRRHKAMTHSSCS